MKPGRLILIAALTLITLSVAVNARINHITSGTTRITTTAAGNAPAATPIHTFNNTSSTRSGFTYELTGLTRRAGNHLTVELFTPTQSMLRPISEYAGAELTSNQTAQYALTILPETDNGRYTLKNRDWQPGTPITHMHAGDKTGTLMYVTEDVTVGATWHHHGREEGGILELTAGWNLIINEILNPSNGSTRTYTAPLDTLTWHWQPSN